MRYSSALVLSTLAVGQAAAANVRHASFHARRQAEKKRTADYDAVNWSEVSYDLSDVDWSSVFNTDKPAATPTPEPAPSSEVIVESTPTPTPEPAPEPASSAPAATSEAAAPAPSATEEPNLIDDITEGVTDLLEGVQSWISSMGISAVGANAKDSSGGIWISDESAWKATFTNDASDDVMLLCWNANGFTGMTLNVNAPAISINIPSGKSETISFTGGTPGACCPAYKDTTLADFGGCDNTWFEYTFGDYGAFDITRNVKMNGNTISAKGSKCTSDMETCVFKCTGDVNSCEKGYDLYNCGASNGGGGGFDEAMQGTGGGCAMGATDEHVKVTFS